MPARIARDYDAQANTAGLPPATIGRHGSIGVDISGGYTNEFGIGDPLRLDYSLWIKRPRGIQKCASMNNMQRAA